MPTYPKTRLSILIPTYNYSCANLVQELHRQATEINISFEIIVAEDGSYRKETIENNKSIQQLPFCKHIINKKNIGRAAIRNFLAQQSKYEFVLYIDSDMIVQNPFFIQRYVECNCPTVIYGGISIKGDPLRLKNNLRYMYEKHNEQAHNLISRCKNPYQNFHTANFLIARHLIMSYPFDERFLHYGYEDVLFGKELRNNNIEIHHIDNPLSFEVFESNGEFIQKTEEGLQTLMTFRKDLEGYNRLISIANRIYSLPFILKIISSLFNVTRKHTRKMLIEKSPRIWLFNMYRLGYYLSLINNKA